MLGYKVRHVGHCGMETHSEFFEIAEEARQDAAEFIRSMRQDGFPVTTLEQGQKWEILEPEDCSMVPDQCGILWIERVAGECFECGCECDTAARYCESCIKYLYY